MSLSNPISSKRTAPRLATLAVAMLLAVGTATSAHAGAQEDARSANAVRVLTDIQAIPESAIPDKLPDEARALVVVPDTLKVGLVLGRRRGHGLTSVKTRAGAWSNQVFVKPTGGSTGLPPGLPSADVGLVFAHDRHPNTNA